MINFAPEQNCTLDFSQDLLYNICRETKFGRAERRGVLRMPLEVVETVKKDNRVFVLVDGEAVPRKVWAVERFNEGNKRGDIAKALGVPVQTIFGYTKGLENEFHKPGSGTFGKSVNIVHPLTNVEMPRSEVIRDLYAGGMSRGEIAKVTETSYQVVYGLTRAPKEGVIAEGDEDGEGDGDEENIL